MRFFRQSGVAVWGLIGYFWLKVVAAVAYGYYHLITRNGGDTWAYHRYGLEETALLRTSPLKFITSTFHSGYGDYGGFLATKNSFWNDLDANAIPKLLALCNIFTGGNYYINAIFINFMFLLGPVLLLKAWEKRAQGISPFWQYMPFLIPSFVFWTSGIHKEGFLVLAIGLVTHALFAYPENSTKTVSRLLQIIVALAIMMVLRNFLLLPTAVALLSWILIKKLRLSAAVSLCVVLISGFILLFGAGHMAPEQNAWKTLDERRAAFLKKRGGSKTEVVNLKPVPASFVRNAPAAFAIGAFRPLPGDVQNVTSGFAALESTALLLLLGLALYRLRFANWSEAFLPFCLYFSISCFMIIGYTIPFLGAVVRYRSIALPLWVMALVLMSKLPTARNKKT